MLIGSFVLVDLSSVRVKVVNSVKSGNGVAFF